MSNILPGGATIHDGTVVADDARRGDLQRHLTLNGIDFLEVVTAPDADNQRVLQVHFLPPVAPATAAKLDALLAEIVTAPDHVTISGGVRIKDVIVIKVTRVEDTIAVRVDTPGDFSTYTLAIQSALLDPFYAQIEFHFKAGCPSHFDCRPLTYCPPDVSEPPPIDYMAKDYASFRQALINLIPNLVPGWAERREADFSMTLLELLAYAGDQLSYFQDAVANEAYLETARQRISVRRHARLIDYAMHDGLSAATFVHFKIAKIADDAEVVINEECIIQLLTRPPNIPLDGARVPPDRAELALDAADAIFEVLVAAGDDIRFHARLNEIPLYAFGNQQVYLPAGGTQATLVGDLAWMPADSTRDARWRLKPGDLLLFEEVKGPEEGVAADADPAHRQVVRLTAARPATDKLLEKDLTVVEWEAADALRFPVCIASLSARTGQPLTGISVARGNLALAYHGRTVEDWHPSPPPAPGDTGVQGIQPGGRAYRFLLQRPELSFMPAYGVPRPPVSTLQAASPRGAQPGVTKLTEHLRDTVRSNEWGVVTPDLLASGRFAPEVVVETDNLGRALVRFGDGQFGREPTQDAFMHVTYRVGVGASGNVGADALTHFRGETIRHGPQDRALVPGPLSPDIVAIRNPVPAWGGSDPEPNERVKQHAPAAFRGEMYRAVTEEDYARAAMKHPAVRSAVATFRWTGSWHTVFVAVDPANSVALTPELRRSVAIWINRFRLAGYDLEINAPSYVPMMLDLDVCVSAGYFPSDVEQALLAALSSHVNPDRSLGFFHPDKFTFGDPLYLSKLYAATAAVSGVEMVTVTRFARRYEADPDPTRPATRRNLENGYIAAGRLEIIRLDNDPSFPENGLLRIDVRGGQ